MSISIEQIRVLDCVIREGSIAKAAVKLHKVHSAVIYTLKTLEDQTGLKLFDRSGYRIKPTLEGRRLWQEGLRLIEVEKDLNSMILTMKHGWEPFITIVFDGIMPFKAILSGISGLSQKSRQTRIILLSDFLGKVEERFHSEMADIMLSIVPVQDPELQTHRLRSIRAHLVCSKSHALAMRKSLEVEDLMRENLITVRGSDLRLNLSTESMATQFVFQVNDFQAKKEALLRGMGFGWMPHYLIEEDLKKESLVMVPWEGKNKHLFHPFLAHRKKSRLGQAGRLLIERFIKEFGLEGNGASRS